MSTALAEKTEGAIPAVAAPTPNPVMDMIRDGLARGMSLDCEDRRGYRQGERRCIVTVPPQVRPGRGSDKFPLRFPDGLRDRIKASAAENQRTMNAEIIHRLNAYTNQEPAMADDKKSSTLTVRLSEETRAKLDALSQRGPYRISLTSIVERGIELAAEELAKLK